MQNEEYDGEEFCVNIIKSISGENIIKADEPDSLNESLNTAREDNDRTENTKEENNEESEHEEKAKRIRGRPKFITTPNVAEMLNSLIEISLP